MSAPDRTRDSPALIANCRHAPIPRPGSCHPPPGVHRSPTGPARPGQASTRAPAPGRFLCCDADPETPRHVSRHVCVAIFCCSPRAFRGFVSVNAAGRYALLLFFSCTGGGRPGLVLCMRPPPPLDCRGHGANGADFFFFACSVEGGTMCLVLPPRQHANPPPPPRQVLTDSGGGGCVASGPVAAPPPPPPGSAAFRAGFSCADCMTHVWLARCV